MRKDLSSTSEAYYQDNYYYELFSKAEDYPNYVLDILKKYSLNKIILDAGCGSGKYLEDIQSIASIYYGIDLSDKQISIASTKVSDKNKVKLICSDLTNAPLLDESIDLIYCTWVLGTILDVDKRNKVLDELKRVLKPNGEILLVDNNIGGEFEIIRGRYPDTKRTLDYHNWIMNNKFKVLKEIDSYFEFKDVEEARKVFKIIYGDGIANKINDKKIEHKIIIYRYKKR
jgi:ubiquinone/menaquinone biosynthesis C-methylase UbiE